MYERFGKRVFDIVASVSLLVVLAPLLVVLLILVRCFLGSPVIFRQMRPGKHEKPFFIYKLRTMTTESDLKGGPLPDSKRLTKFGTYLRTTSLDELPELVNVLAGQMSLVGPRPLLTKYQSFYSARECKRFNVRPGITGWAQVHGRNATAWNERLSFDVWYTENISFTLDFRILIKTLLKAIRREGVIVDPRSTMLDLDVERSVNAEGNNLQAR
jgi:lipopolysaccharide/colanic/teichoic acid biosynthesis glycosyltransferase